MNKTINHRKLPVKPTKKEPVQKSGIVDQKSALSILHDFYMAAKKEIKGATEVSLCHETDVTSLSFVSDGFNLQLNFTEGRTAL